MFEHPGSIESDLHVICKEYKKYFKQTSVVQVNGNGKPYALIIKTNEGDEFNVGISPSGWFLRNKVKPSYYETFEGLMNDVYPQFCNTFANDLLTKLNALQ